MSGRTKVERGNGNIFTDLGFPKAEAENLLLRAKLMSKIRAVARDMTQAQAAKRFGVSQPRLNDLLRGKIEKFSLDALVNMLAAAGLHIELRIRRAA
jgi:predicted XRE-type DNA-binding protein